MKKNLLPFLMVLLANFAFAQSPRVVLYEEFTGENCGPCAAANPTLNALLAANPTSTIISLKFEVPIPSSAGPNSIYGANTADVSTRTSFYSVPFAPYGRLDGFEQVDASGQGNDGHVSFLTQPVITSRSAVTSPFTLNLSHSMNASFDTATVTAVITASQAYTAFGALKFRLALIEKEIHLAVPTGSNGEKDFFSTMRKMVPDANGTLITGTWTNTQTQTLTFKVPVPSYVYDLSQIGFVGFIQDDGSNSPSTYSVQQAAYSAPIPVPSTFLDGAVANATVAPSSLCSTNVTPIMNLTNNTTNTITSAVLSYSINGGTAVTQSWTGTLANGASTTVTFPSATVPVGSVSIVGNIVSLNGTGVDYNKTNNMTTPVEFTIIPTTTVGTNINENFESSAVGADAPANAVQINPYGAGSSVYVVDKSVNSSVTQNIGGFGLSAKSFRWRLPDFNNGDALSLVFEKINLTGKTNSGLTFSRAYARWDANSSDVLTIKVSTNCGATYTTVYTKSSSALATGANLSGAYYYPQPAEWAKEVVDLKAYDNAPELLINFEVTTGSGNNLYIDDVNVDAGLAPNGIEHTSLTNSTIDVYPNPATTKLNLNFGSNTVNNGVCTIMNSIGQVVLIQQISSTNNSSINISELNAGNYIVTIKTDKEVFTNKFIKE